MPSLSALAAAHADLSWVSHLSPESSSPEPARAQDFNKTSREVRSGHFVLVRPTPLPAPRMLHFSRALATEIGLDPAAAVAPGAPDHAAFLKFFSGDISEPSFSSSSSSSSLPWGTTWATPYALSIYGQEMYDNCPFKNGNGYGDGRAISVGEILNPDTNTRYELQLKGAGTTPFCRGGDGRAVLRSSVREFLVSEAMHELGVSTTRALSLIVSDEETVQRPWYDPSKSTQTTLPDENDPRLQRVPPEYRKMLIQQLLSQARGPDRMVNERCAITCRVAPSFLRVGHVELFARRARKAGTAAQVRELRQIVQHALVREYPECLEATVGGVAGGASKSNIEGDEGDDFASSDQILAMLRQASHRFAALMADWIRVGYCQGNFNSDNCLVGGRTMDYGPFGFMEKFEPLWNMWVGGGEHYGFMNQTVAGEKNFASLVGAVICVLDSDEDRGKAKAILREHRSASETAMTRMWARKLGLVGGEAKIVNELAARLLHLMDQSEADWTMTWRQLAAVVEMHAARGGGGDGGDGDGDGKLLEPLRDCFYSEDREKNPITGQMGATWSQWILQWLGEVERVSGHQPVNETAALMRQASPKYVPREWMLVTAYENAQRGDYDMLRNLHDLFQDPYAEGRAEQEAAYFRKAPKETYLGVGKAGTAYMS